METWQAIPTPLYELRNSEYQILLRSISSIFDEKTENEQKYKINYWIFLISNCDTQRKT